jgi:hypothetical protein
MMRKESTSKSIRSKGLHEWTKEELMVAFYLTKYGNKNIYLKSEGDVAKYFGVSVGSLKMQIANFRYLLGDRKGSLSDYSKDQEMIFEDYNGMDWLMFNRQVRNIISQDDFERAQALKKMGKDVSKMRLVS